MKNINIFLIFTFLTISCFRTPKQPFVEVISEMDTVYCHQVYTSKVILYNLESQQLPDFYLISRNQDTFYLPTIKEDDKFIAFYNYEGDKERKIFWNGFVSFNYKGILKQLEYADSFYVKERTNHVLNTD